MKRIQFTLILLLLSLPLKSQEVSRSVVGSGAATMENSEFILRGTVGQTHIGRIQNTDFSKGLGFWYTVENLFDNIERSSLVTIPTIEAEIGENITIPIMLMNSRNLQDEPNRWRAKVRFNSTILYPLDEDLNCGTDEICTLEITGENTDSTGVLYELEFKSKLGSVENTDLEIIEFEWIDNNISTLTKNGFFQLKGVCTVDGEVRLIKRTVAAGITGVYPNPVKGNFNIDYQLREKGNSIFEIIDSKGERLKVFDVNETEPGVYNLETEIGLVPSGSYFLVLRTPNEVFTKRILVEK